MVSFESQVVLCGLIAALSTQHSALILYHHEQIALERQDMPCAYLAHHEQESTYRNIVIPVVIVIVRCHHAGLEIVDLAASQPLVLTL